MSSRQLLFKIAQQYPGWILLTVILGFSGGLFNGVSTALIVPVLLNFLGQEIDLQGVPPLIQSLLSPFSGQDPTLRLLIMTGLIVLLITLKNVATYLNSIVSGVLRRAIANDLREQGLDLVLTVDIDFYSRMGIGDLMNRINNEVGRTATAVSTAVKAITTVITILIFVGFLLALSWQLTIASTVLLGVVTLANQITIARSRVFGKQLSDLSKRYSIGLLDVMAGMRLVRSTASETTEYQHIKRLMRDREEAEFASQANSALVNPISEVTGIIALILIVLLGRLFLSDQIAAVSTILLTYLLILFRTLPLISQLNSARDQFSNTSPSVEVVVDFLRRDNKPFMKNGSILFTGLTQGIAFKSLSFSYPGRDHLILKNIELYLPKGTTLALVGASGAGKSTLADLLPRFYDPTAGFITVDGVDLRELDFRTFRKSMGIVSQDTFLFNTTVRHNIAYANPSATDDEILQAAKLANAYEFIERLPQGLDTQIGDRGVLLSGGQRQRLAIARALLQNPEILILDEATSALDTVSERLVQEAIDHLSRDRTTLVIAHRLSTVQKADQIAVMEKGEVVELGTHTELLQKDGYYARLCAMQFSDDGREDGSQRTQIVRTSYEMRTRLNSMIGSLRLMVDGIIDDPEESAEMTGEAYYSALQLLNSLEKLEREPDRQG